MKFVSFRDKPLNAVEWLLLFASYILPAINVWFFTGAWFIFPTFALIFLMISPRSILVRFNFVQSFLCFVIFTLIITIATLFPSVAPGDRSVQMFSFTLFLTFGFVYIVLMAIIIIGLIFRRYLKLPFSERIIRKFAGRYVYGTDPQPDTTQPKEQE